jgi:triacylglycerol lipase
MITTLPGSLFFGMSINIRMTNPLQYEVTQFYSHVDGPISQMNEAKRALLFCELSIIAYFDSAAAQSWGRMLGFEGVSQVSAVNNSATIFWNNTDLVVAFRGTDNIENAVQDVDCFLVRDQNLPGSVHQGFLNSFNELNAQFAPLSAPLLQGRAVWATGHSLGGSLAAIMSVRATRNAGPALAGVYTFAQPRIGDAAYIRGAFPALIRYVDKFDIGPHLPPLIMGYRHFGQELYITTDNTIVAIKSWKSFLVKGWAELWGVIRLGITDHSVQKYRAVLRNAYQASLKS